MVGVGANRAVPTSTATGIVWRSVPLISRICPANSPAMRPALGSEAVFTLTAIEPGVLPLVAEMLSQSPPSAVVATADQGSAPGPLARIGIDCGGGLVLLPVVTENVTAPCISAKYVAVDGFTVSVTGTTVACELAFPVKMISDV